MTPVHLTAITGALRRAELLVATEGELPSAVEAITDDSRAVRRGALFVAVRGSERDGHDFLPAALDAGASVAVVEDSAATGLPRLVVRDGRRAAAIAAAAFYGEPARKLRLVGVTGTNGKTTVVGMLRHLLDEPASRSASIGTLGTLIGSQGIEMPGGNGLTTPGPVELQRVLCMLVKAGVRTVAIETSSHALDQRRLEGLHFAAGVFTNVTRDHLDYHGTMEAYVAAKGALVGLIERGGTAVVNADDTVWTSLAARRRMTFGLSRDANVRAESVRFTPRGSEWQLVMGDARYDVALGLLGAFNVSNALAAAAAANVLGAAPAAIAHRLASLPQVPGRLEIINERPTVLRDYAHTPDALDRAIDAVRPFTTGSLIVVFGCGGDRDRGKRPEMGRIAEQKADRVIITSDNPRTEDPEQILDDIEAGMRGTHVRITDRQEAITYAVREAASDDVILLAGKGHETYQIRGTVKYPFDEREIVQSIVSTAVR